MVHSDRKVPPNIHHQKQFVCKEEPLMPYNISPMTRLTVLNDGSGQNSIELSDYNPYENREEDPELWEIRHILSNGQHLVRLMLLH